MKLLLNLLLSMFFIQAVEFFFFLSFQSRPKLAYERSIQTVEIRCQKWVNSVPWSSITFREKHEAHKISDHISCGERSTGLEVITLCFNFTFGTTEVGLRE
jgi:hypothetical protein